MPNKLRILLIQGGISSEREVSLNSGAAIVNSLDTSQYDICVATVNQDGSWKFGHLKQLLLSGQALAYIEHAKFDIGFIALHGRFGEDGQIQAMFDAISLPYTGSNCESSAIAMNKAAANILFQHSGLEVPSFIHILKRSEYGLFDKFSFPAIIKPCHGGSSLGVQIVHNFRTARLAVGRILKEGDSAIIQKYIAGREFTCGILEDGRGNPRPLPPTEIIPRRQGLFDYKSKYVFGQSQEITPPNLTSSQIKILQQQAVSAHQALGCSGMSRSDFILAHNLFYILETNTIPGMTKMSLLPQAASVAGISFSEMLDCIIQNAFAKSLPHTLRRTKSK
jgi:D-alanine-D-alanine ligase